MKDIRTLDELINIYIKEKLNFMSMRLLQINKIPVDINKFPHTQILLKNSLTIFNLSHLSSC